MPYIKTIDRDRYTPKVQTPDNAGELNFQITMLLLQFIYGGLRHGESPRYEDFNAAIGALECAKLELYRRMVAPYEDNKIEENGDVY